MTREEAIERIKDHMEAHHIGEYPHIKLKEALDMALSSLRPVTREQAEKVWKGTWVDKYRWDDSDENDICEVDDEGHIVGLTATCPYCGEWLVASDEWDVFANFCPSCGKAMSKKAIDIVMERLESLSDGSTTD